jgi:hypothetical protein
MTKWIGCMKGEGMRMKRLTKISKDGGYIATADLVYLQDAGYAGEAIEKLACFETFYDDLLRNQSEISNEMEMLRNEEKTHSPRFKELFTKKMINNNILIILKQYGL